MPIIHGVTVPFATPVKGFPNHTRVLKEGNRQLEFWLKRHLAYFRDQGVERPERKGRAPPPPVSSACTANLIPSPLYSTFGIGRHRSRDLWHVSEEWRPPIIRSVWAGAPPGTDVRICACGNLFFQFGTYVYSSGRDNYFCLVACRVQRPLLIRVMSVNFLVLTIQAK